MPTWSLGDSVVLRNTGFFVGEVWGTPHVVVRDTPDLIALYRPEGTRWAGWDLDNLELKPANPTRMDVLRLMYPGRRYAIELYFATSSGQTYGGFDGEGRFRGWKVNIEGPLLRTAIGFDTTDDILDIFVRPDRTFFWTDKEELDFWLEIGAYTNEDRRNFYAAGREAQSLIEAGLPPFDGEWAGWGPPADFRPPQLPKGWQFVPGADVIRSNGRRFDDWRPGHDVPAVRAAWYDLLARNREDELRRRFVPAVDAP